jgi:hypothetical protein
VGSTAASVGGIDFTDSEQRPTVRSFLEANAARTCFINGFEVRSVTHERCRRILFTGSSGGAADDWPSITAGSASGYLLPSLVLSGPSYTSVFGNTVVRVGPDGQLGPLLDDTALQQADVPLVGQNQPVNDAVSAAVAARVALAQGTALPGRPTTFLSDYAASLAQAVQVQAIAGQVDLTPPESDACSLAQDRVIPGLTCLELGYSRSVLIQHAGFCDLAWDSHSGIELQGQNFELLFQDLTAIMAELDARVGTSGRPLSEEVTVVVLSEMGRTPKLNATGGKDHWTYTSAMLIGAGVAGGRVLGGYDDTFIGVPVDPSTGEASSAGETLSAGSLGATLLAMADIDPGEYTSSEPILGAMS